MTASESIHTARLFASYAQDGEVTRFLTWRPHTALSESQKHIERSLQKWCDGSELSWFLFAHSDGSLVGSIGARIKPGEIELGYVLARPCWGQGLMLEAVSAVVEWAFMHSSVLRVRAFCDTENRASARPIEKAGFRREGVLERWSVHPNISALPRDCYSYARTRDN